MSGVPQAERPPGRRAALTLLKIFLLKTKKKKKIGNSKTKKNQGNILMGASWLGLFCLQGEAQNFALPAKTLSEGK